MSNKAENVLLVFDFNLRTYLSYLVIRDSPEFLEAMAMESTSSSSVQENCSVREDRYCRALFPGSVKEAKNVEYLLKQKISVFFFRIKKSTRDRNFISCLVGLKSRSTR